MRACPSLLQHDIRRPAAAPVGLRVPLCCGYALKCLGVIARENLTIDAALKQFAAFCLVMYELGITCDGPALPDKL